MKLRKFWIAASLLFVIGGVIKICDTLFNVHGTGFVLSTTACNLTLAACVVVLYDIGIGLSIADRKKTFRAEPTKNMFCGVFGFIASVTLLGGGVVRIIAGENLAESILAVLAGIVLLYEACISFTGVNGLKKLPVIALIVPIWCCTRFIMLFINYNQKSLLATELFDIVAVAFLIMFLFYQSMYFAAINNRLAVRKAAVYGVVFIMLNTIVCADLIIKMVIGTQPQPNIDTQVVEANILNIMMIVGDLAFSCYAFFFIREILKTADSNLTLPDEHHQDDLLMEEAEAGIEEVPLPPHNTETTPDTPDTGDAADTADNTDLADKNSTTAESVTPVPTRNEEPTDITKAVTTVEGLNYYAAKQDAQTPITPVVHKIVRTKDDTPTISELFTLLDKMHGGDVATSHSAVTP